MKGKWYVQPTIEQISELAEKTRWIEWLDEKMWWCLSMPWAWLAIDEKSRCRPFVINNNYYSEFKNWIVVNGFKKRMIFKSVYSWADKRIQTVDFSNKYRDHGKARVIFLKIK